MTFTERYVLAVLPILFVILLLDAYVLWPLRKKAEEPPPAAEELAPSVRLVVLRPGIYEALLDLGAPARGCIVIAKEDPAALVRTWREAGSPALDIRIPSTGAVAGLATNLLVESGALLAEARLNRAGAAAFVSGIRSLDASLEASRGVLHGPGAAAVPAMRPTRIDHLRLVDKPRFH